MADFVLWEALHEDCPEQGCGGCTPIELDEDCERMLAEVMAVTGQTAAQTLRQAIREYIRKFAA